MAEKKKKLLIALTSATERARLEQEFSGLEDVEVLPSVDNGAEALVMALDRQVEILLIDLVLRELDGGAVIDTLAKLPEEKRPAIFIITALSDDRILEKWGDKAAYCFIKPYDISRVSLRVQQLALSKDGVLRAPQYLQEATQLENAIIDILHELDVPRHVRGNIMVRNGIGFLAIAPDPTRLRITRDIYPRLAQIHNCDVAAVEYAIRSALEHTWTYGNLKAIDKYFGNTVDGMRAKPSNSEFMHRIADLVRKRPSPVFMDTLTDE